MMMLRSNDDLVATPLSPLTSLSGVKTLVPAPRVTPRSTQLTLNIMDFPDTVESETGIWEGGDLHIDDSVKGSSSVYNLEGTTSE